MGQHWRPHACLLERACAAPIASRTGHPTASHRPATHQHTVFECAWSNGWIKVTRACLFALCRVGVPLEKSDPAAGGRERSPTRLARHSHHSHIQTHT